MRFSTFILLNAMLSTSYTLLFLLLFVSFCLALLCADAQLFRRVRSKKFAYYNIVVDQSGHGNFRTVQSAIDSIPSGNIFWTSIKVKAGTYREKVRIPYDKQYIILKGEGRRKTEVIWDDHDNLLQSPTFISEANNTVIRSISFRNSYNNPLNNKRRVPAVAVLVLGDRTSFYKCNFYGVQDTLWDEQGRHYYKRCTIQGAVDFIFGSGQSIFEQCTINMLGKALDGGLPGFITAQGRDGATETNGFVFNNCSVLGTGSTYLGRPWRSYARVFFYNTYMSTVVQPKGWQSWNSQGSEQQLDFAEHGCYGPGSDISRRVTWETRLDVKAIQQRISMSFIDNDGWLTNQPI